MLEINGLRGGVEIRYTVIIPTLNAGNKLENLLRSLSAQSLPPDEILVVDSQSEDETPQLVKAHKNTRLIQIERTAFDHGGTRDMAFRSCSSPTVVLMTQDALPADGQCMEALLRPLKDERVAAVCARQIAYETASAAEKAVRAFRYPEEGMAWGREDVSRLGMRAYLLSDVCTAYRRSAYEAVGGFEHPLITNEDMLIAADFLDHGYRLAYQAEAKVWHSHSCTLRQEYQRNRCIGQFLARYGDRFSKGGEMGEGLRMVRFVTKKLLSEGRIGAIVPFWGNCAARLLGNRAGKQEERRRMLSNGSHY